MKLGLKLPPPADPSWCEVSCAVPTPGRTEETEVKVSGPLLVRGPSEGKMLGYLAPPGVEAWEWVDDERWEPALPVGILHESHCVGLIPVESPAWPLGLWLRQNDARPPGGLAGQTFTAKEVQIEDCSSRASTLAKGFGVAFATGVPPDTDEVVHLAARAAARLSALEDLATDLRAAWDAVNCPDECPHKRARFLTVVGWRVHMDSAAKAWIGIGPIFVSAVALEAAIEIEFYCVSLV